MGKTTTLTSTTRKGLREIARAAKQHGANARLSFHKMTVTVSFPLVGLLTPAQRLEDLRFELSFDGRGA